MDTPPSKFGSLALPLPPCRLLPQFPCHQPPPPRFPAPATAVPPLGEPPMAAPPPETRQRRQPPSPAATQSATRRPRILPPPPSLQGPDPARPGPRPGPEQPVCLAPPSASLLPPLARSRAGSGAPPAAADPQAGSRLLLLPPSPASPFSLSLTVLSLLQDAPPLSSPSPDPATAARSGALVPRYGRSRPPELLPGHPLAGGCAAVAALPWPRSASTTRRVGHCIPPAQLAGPLHPLHDLGRAHG